MFLCKYSLCVSYFRALGVLSLFVILFSGCSKQGLEAPKGGSEVRPSQMKLKRKIELYKIIFFSLFLLYSYILNISFKGHHFQTVVFSV
jgi:hypothetical protein